MNKWIPETRPIVLRRVGKTAEECAELSKVCSRITIQGLEGVDPSTGISNREALAMEAADVVAQCYTTISVLGLDQAAIRIRVIEKQRLMAEWEAMFEEEPPLAAEPSKRELQLEELLRSACCIAARQGRNTAWERFIASADELGVSGVTARAYRANLSDL